MYPTRKERMEELRRNRQNQTFKKGTAFLSTTLLLSTLALPSFSVKASANETATRSHTTVKALSEEQVSLKNLEVPIEKVESEEPKEEIPSEELPKEEETGEQTNPEKEEVIPVTPPKEVAPTPPVKAPVVPSPAQQPQSPKPVAPKQPVKQAPAAPIPSKNEASSELEPEEESIHYAKTQTTEEFIASVAPSAVEVGTANDLYPSVMIAQAILESGSGGSSLSKAPNHNLFGVKGNYQGSTVKMKTQEDNGRGDLFSISSQFRKYPSYKESFLDYAKVIKDGPGFNADYYKGVWRSNTTSYKDATKWLTGRYATDTRYAAKLNGLIECYNLTQFDDVPKQKPVYHIVQADDTLWEIAEQYGVSVDEIKAWNQLETNLIYTGTELIVGFPEPINKQEAKTTEQVVLDKATRTIQHIVQGKESLQSIAKSYQMNPRTLKKMNGLTQNVLFIGQHLTIQKTTNQQKDML
ncbi:glucosaminidase domain-containing protein [Isobaculum melis]|uniref:Peptidoglycan hydrolase n=1 Tax=Isobaculum melis TaxID=142588 RepID=A0A1H9RJU1_9LACT|nr:glucosaminidase domain-containing protein [Isobaculum melis]SER72897.1 Flagellum-specific peptidoglycan hydrolase FlgJ [Isobaculum melis]